jgi:hypothetical protein
VPRNLGWMMGNLLSGGGGGGRGPPPPMGKTNLCPTK